MSDLANGRIPKRIFTYWEGEWTTDAERCWASIEETYRPLGYDVFIIQHMDIYRNSWYSESIDPAFFFDFLKLRSQRADYIRFFELYERGGWWFDTDVVSLKPIPEELREYDFVAGYESPEYINNAVMGAKPGHILLQYALMRFPNYARFGRSATAPMLLTEAIKEYDMDQPAAEDAKQCCIVPEQYFYPIHWTCRKEDVAFDRLTVENFPNSYAIHRWDWIWRRYE